MGTCTLCKLSSNVDQETLPTIGVPKRHGGVIDGEGDPSSSLWVIGEAPGAVEEKEGRPFVGPSGQVLDQMLEEAGIERSSIYIDNIVKCRPPDNEEPDLMILSTCFEAHLAKLAREYKPKVIVLAGKTAAKAFGLLGKKGSVFGPWVGKIVISRKWDCLLMPIYHPAALLREIEEGTDHHADVCIEALREASRWIDQPRFKPEDELLTILATKPPEVKDVTPYGGFLAIDIETTGLNPREHQITGVAISPCDWVAQYFPWQLLEKSELFREMLRDEAVKKVFHNAKFDVSFFRAAGFEVNGVWMDTLLASHLIDEEFPLDLKSLAHSYTTWGGYDEGIDPLTADEESLARYSCMDAITTRQLANTFRILLGGERSVAPAPGRLWIFEELSMPLLEALMGMEEVGVKVDVPYLRVLGTEYGKTLESSVAVLRGISGDGSLNVNSPIQVRKVLYDKLGLEPWRLTKKSELSSTDEETLESFVKEKGKGGEFCRELLKYRKIKKLLSTYVEPLVEKADPNGVVHTTYRQTGTATGRLSSADPNLQNIPIRGEEGKRIRNAFVAREGCVFVDGDFSQIELRILAKFSRDPLFVEAYTTEGGDLHRATAALLYKIPREQVTKEQRSAAKTINFGIIYGMGPRKLSRETGMPLEQAKEFIARYWKEIPLTKATLERFHGEARERGFVMTPFGRVRHLPEIHDKREARVGEVERQAGNSPIQGGAGDCTNLALVRIWRRLKAEHLKAHILLQVHDEIVVEAPLEEALDVKALMAEEMERPMPAIDIPLKAEVEIVRRWKGEEVHRFPKKVLRGALKTRP